MNETKTKHANKEQVNKEKETKRKLKIKQTKLI